MSPRSPSRSRSLSFLILFGLSCVLVGQSYDDWTAEDVISRIETVNGGEEAINEVNNVRVQGEVLSDDRAYDFVLLKKRPNKVRIQLHYRMGSITTGFDGEEAWRRLRQRERTRVEELDASEFAKQSLETDFDGPLIGPVPEGVERKFVGVERIDRVDYLVMEVHYGNSFTLHYIDPRTFRELKMSKFVEEDGEFTEVASARYKDYDRFGPFWLATRIERELASGVREILRIESVELNTAILDRVFEKPSEDGLLGG